MLAKQQSYVSACQIISMENVNKLCYNWESRIEKGRKKKTDISMEKIRKEVDKMQYHNHEGPKATRVI